MDVPKRARLSTLGYATCIGKWGNGPLGHVAHLSGTSSIALRHAFQRDALKCATRQVCTNTLSIIVPSKRTFSLLRGLTSAAPVYFLRHFWLRQCYAMSLYLIFLWKTSWKKPHCRKHRVTRAETNVIATHDTIDTKDIVVFYATAFLLKAFYTWEIVLLAPRHFFTNRNHQAHYKESCKTFYK